MSLLERAFRDGWADCGCRWRAKVLGVAACLLAASAFGQVGPSREGKNAEPAPRLYRIAGSVTDSVTGKALAGATMHLLNTQARETLQSVTTDAEGHFALEPVPAAKYSLTAQRRGYLAAALDEHDGFSSAVVTGDGQDTEHLAFKLNEGAVLRGTVTDESGEPVNGATVVAVRRSRQGGLGEHLEHMASGSTAEDGRFEFWNVRPGAYFLAVQGRPWYAVHPPASAVLSAGAESARDRAALDVAYPVTFYGDTTEEASATPIEIHAGARVQADVTLHTVPSLRLSVLPPGDDTSRKYFSPALRQTVFGDRKLLYFRATQQEESEAVGSDVNPVEAVPAGRLLSEFDELAPGQYTVVDNESARAMEVNLNGDKEVDLGAGSPLFSVDLKMRMADGSALPPQTALSLVSLQSGHQDFGPNIGDGTSTRFIALPPGQWTVEAQAMEGILAVISVQTGAASRDDSRIEVKDRSISGSVVLAQGKTSIEGFAKKNGKGQAGVMIVLVPRDPEGGLQRFRRDQSDSDGSFLLPNVVPGEYSIVAIEDGWDLDWARPKAIAAYLAGGVGVSVTAKSGTSLHLSTAVEVQAR